MTASKLDIAAIYANESDFKSINCNAVGSMWGDFVKGIILSIENRSKMEYPYVKLNADNSVSFFLEESKNVLKPTTPKQKFSKDLNESYIIEQLDYCREQLELNKINSNESFLTKTQHLYDVVEYKFNISPKVFDSLLKKQSSYSYRGENSLLKLYKKFTLAPGKISLFPVSPITPEENLVRAVGCQLVELFTIQLLHLLPDYDGEEKYFHWVPQKVAHDLQLDRSSVMSLLNTIFERNQILTPMNVVLIKMSTDPMQLSIAEWAKKIKKINALILFNNELFYLNQRPWSVTKITIDDANKKDYDQLLTVFTGDKEEVDKEGLKLISSVMGTPIPLKPISAQGSEGCDMILTPSLNAKVKMVDIDPDVEHFYLLYGNCGAEELKMCKSIEISTCEILQYLQEYLKSQQTASINEKNKPNPNLNLVEYYEKRIDNLEKSLNIVQKMITIEENRIKNLAQENQKAPEGSLSIFGTSTTQQGVDDIKEVKINPT